MKTMLFGAALTVALIAGSGAALARGGGGGGDAGSGLSPYSALNGNDRSAGVNNGNYRDPRLDPYLQTYGGYGDDAPRYRRAPVGRPYYGYPY